MITRVRMYSKVVQIIAHVVVVFTSSCVCQDDGIVISLGDSVIPNHGLVSNEDIGVDRTGSDLTVGLSCNTTYVQCCTGSESSMTASWHLAHFSGSIPPSSTSDTFSFNMNRIGQAVYLFRNHIPNDPTVTNGIWRCTIPDSNGDTQTKYIGIYTRGMTGVLSARSPGKIQFQDLTTNEFNLTFKTTGGPATYVTWTRDGADISSLETNRYMPSQNVLPNGGLYTAGDYSNILTVSGSLPGVYGVSVTNDRTTTPVTSNIAVLDYPQAVITSSSAMQSATDGDITIAWTVSNSSLVSRIFEGYEIQYKRCPLGQQNGCIDLQLVTISDTTITQYTLTNVVLWSTYEFSIAVVNKSNHHYFPGVSGLSVTGIQVSTRGVLPPEITSVIEPANITSVQVTWNQPEGGLAVDEYVVSYRRLNGRDGQCSSFQDEGNVTVMVGGERETILHLKAYYSTYTVNVTGRKGVLYNTSSLNFETNSTVPSGAPQNLAIINSNSTSVTISWDGIDCIHRNGMITHYLIVNGPVDEANQMTNVSVNSNRPDNGGSYTTTGLDATQNYIFKVAAVNSDGVGVFATVSTNKPFQAPELVSVLTLNVTSVQVTWNQPEGRLAVDEYVVSYHRLNGIDGQCSSFQHGGSVILNGSSNRINLHLQAYSVYVVNVTGRNGGLQNTSVIQLETNSKVPTAPPQSLATLNVNSTSVTISWDSVECIHRNGLITHYQLVYEPMNIFGNSLATMIISGDPDDGGVYMAAGLNPSSDYLFKVAAVNNIGVGHFATVTIHTKEGTIGKCTSRTASAAAGTIAGMATVIVVLVLIIVVLSGAIIAGAIWIYKIRGLPTGKGKQSKPEENSTTQDKTADEAVYDEPKILSPKTSLQMEICPAYEVTKT